MDEFSYKKLFNAITDAIDVLQKAQLECEEHFIEQDEKDKEKTY